MRKFRELVDGSFRSWALLSGAPESVELLQRFPQVLKRVEAHKLRETLTRCWSIAVGKSMLKTTLVGVPWVEVASNADGGG